MDCRIRIAESADAPAITRIYNHAVAAGFQTAHTDPIEEGTVRQVL